MAGLPVLGAALYEDLPAVVRLLPPQDEEREGARLQLVLVEGQVVDDHGLLVGAGELEGRMGRPLGQGVGGHVGPEGFGERPEANSEAWRFSG